jgi:hypothetical protein
MTGTSYLKFVGLSAALLSCIVLSGPARGQADADKKPDAKPRWRLFNLFRPAAKKNDNEAAQSTARPSWRDDPTLKYKGVFEDWAAVGNDSHDRVDPYRIPPAGGFAKSSFTPQSASRAFAVRSQSLPPGYSQYPGPSGGYPATLPQSPSLYGPGRPAPLPPTPPTPPPPPKPEPMLLQPHLPAAPLPALKEPDFPQTPAGPREF